MISEHKICILLTGTILPGNVPNLKRSDPIFREQDYYYAIVKWMELDYAVVFVENSGYDSFKIKSLFHRKTNCEFLQFKSKVSFLGKGHGEAEIIKYAFDNSAILKESAIIIKSSGRQYVTNAKNIINSVDYQIIFVVSWLKQNLMYADSRFFVAKHAFYRDYLTKEFDFIDESNSIYFEHVLARAVHRCMADGHRWALPSEYPINDGVSGTENTKYKKNLFSRLKGRLIIMLTNRMLKNNYL